MLNETTSIDCQLCKNTKVSELYSRTQYAGGVLGTLEYKIVMCDNCGFAYSNPRPTEKSIMQHYKSSGSGEVFHENKPNSRHGLLLKERISFINSFLISKTKGQFLDIGCGNGELLIKLDLPGWDLVGLEPGNGSDSVKTKSISIINDVIENLGNQKQYDAISLISSLEHVYDPQKVILIISKLLKKGGVLFIEVPDSKKPIAQIAEFYSFEHLSHFTDYTLEYLLHKNGFKVMKYDKNVSVSNIRCAAVKINDEFSLTLNDDRNELKQAINNYILQRKSRIQLISANIVAQIEFIKSSSGKIAIYGAGVHTNFLLETFDIEQIVSCYIDSDIKKLGTIFRNKIIYTPTEIPNLEVNAILISSHDYESEIFETVKKHNKNKLLVLKCYTK